MKKTEIKVKSFEEVVKQLGIWEKIINQKVDLNKEINVTSFRP